MTAGAAARSGRPPCLLRLEKKRKAESPRRRERGRAGGRGGRVRANYSMTAVRLHSTGGPPSATVGLWGGGGVAGLQPLPVGGRGGRAGLQARLRARFAAPRGGG